MENIIDLKNPRKQKVAWIIHGFAVKVAESHIVTKINFDGEIYQVISAYFQDDCADELTLDPVFNIILDKESLVYCIIDISLNNLPVFPSNCVDFAQRCHRIASFSRLVDEKTFCVI